MEHNMILSASGWRKVFAVSGEEQDKNPAISENDVKLSIIAANVFFDYIKQVSGQKIPVISLGIDARPTGPAIADAMIHALIKKGAIIQYSGITSAPDNSIRNTFNFCLSTSFDPMNIFTSIPNFAPITAVAIPCCPAPVSAINCVLPMYFASKP